MKLSLCIATFNEEANLHYPMDSCYDFVDEVIIVDGGSTDKTCEIAKKYGKKVKIYHETNPPMFHINKQKAIERAKGEWILQLDADEAITDELKKEIQSIISQSQLKSVSSISSTKSAETKTNFNRFQPISTDSTKYVAYWISRKNFFLTRFLMKGGQYPDYTIRLYKNGYAKFPCKTVHENVTLINQNKMVSSRANVNESRDPLNSQQSTIGYLHNPILHYADPNFSRYLKRWHRYNHLEAQSLKLKAQNKSQIFIFLDYIFWKPISTFFLMYFRHKGFMDGIPGFIFAFFSSIRFWSIYFNYNEKLKIKS